SPANRTAPPLPSESGSSAPWKSENCRSCTSRKGPRPLPGLSALGPLPLWLPSATWRARSEALSLGAATAAVATMEVAVAAATARARARERFVIEMLLVSGVGPASAGQTRARYQRVRGPEQARPRFRGEGRNVHHCVDRAPTWGCPPDTPCSCRVGTRSTPVA